MPTIEFAGNEFGPATSAEVTGRAHLVDVCDVAGAPVLFSCRSASCGTCRVEILAGGELLDDPGKDEIDVLEIFGAPPTHRLACQVVVRPGPGTVRLRMVPND
jgi:ferredoxin